MAQGEQFLFSTHPKTSFSVIAASVFISLLGITFLSLSEGEEKLPTSRSECTNKIFIGVGCLSYQITYKVRHSYLGLLQAVKTLCYILKLKMEEKENAVS